tara:strand:+ start:26 stop:187 length:162 start_codon:yes stop_codon:yes gene_type:complete
MRKLLIPFLAAFALPTAVNSGIPQSEKPNNNKLVKINDNYFINTEDVKVRKIE